MYKTKIAAVVEKYNIKSVLIAIDTEDVIMDYEAFFLNLKISYFFISGFNVTYHYNDLQKASIQMLSLSKTNYMMGDCKSTFLLASYYFGECRQEVFDVYDDNET